MTDVAHAHEHHVAPPPRTGIRRWTGPGWLRVLWVVPIFIGIGFAIPVSSAGSPTGSRSGRGR